MLAAQNNRSQGYDIGNGSSKSLAIVTGAAALAWSSHPGATNTAIRADVETTADKVSGTGTYWACGRVNANNDVSSHAARLNLPSQSNVFNVIDTRLFEAQPVWEDRVAAIARHTARHR